MLRYLCLILLVLSGFSWAGPVSMSDDDLGAVSGGQGIAFQMEMFWNASRDSSNTAVLANNSVPLTTSSLNCAAATGSTCSLALQFANRNGADVTGLVGSGYTIGGTSYATPCVTTCTANQYGQWLVFNNFYAGMRIYSLQLDGASLGSAGSSTAYWDPSKFQNASGNCLLNGFSSSAACGSLTGANLTAMNALNALVFTVPTTTTSFSVGNGVVGAAAGEQSSGYTSLELGLNIGRMDIQYATSGTTNTGYLSTYDTGKSFAGLVVGDTSSDAYATSRGATAATMPTSSTCNCSGTFGTPVATGVLSMAGAAIAGKAYVFGF